ncbi:MAG: hypothetical protein AAGL24_05740 [Pseudomonadota bacterium]
MTKTNRSGLKAYLVECRRDGHRRVVEVMAASPAEAAHQVTRFGRGRAKRRQPAGSPGPLDFFHRLIYGRT